MEETRGSFSNALFATDKRLGSIVSRAAGTSKLDKPEAFSSHTASGGAPVGASKGRPSSGHGLRKKTSLGAMLESLGVHDPRDHAHYAA